MGTEVAKDKKTVSMNDKEYLLEAPLGADFAFVVADEADEIGNGFVGKAQKNFNVVMSMAADYTVMEASKIVKVGELDPDRVQIPSVFVKSVVRGA